MVQSRFTKVRNIPAKIKTTRTLPSTTNFADGISCYRPNDAMKASELKLAENVRFDRIGEYKTRRGFKKLSSPIGSTVILNTLSDSNDETNLKDVLPLESSFQKQTIVYAISVKIKRVNNDYTVVRLELYSKSDKIAEACINSNDITEDFREVEVYLMNAPEINGDFTVKITTQSGSKSNCVLKTTGGKLSAKILSCTAGKITNLFEANINGTKTVLFTHNEKLYRMDESGNVVKIRDLPSGVTKVRFNQDLNQIRYVDGKESPRILKPAQDWADSAIPTIDLESDVALNMKMSNIMDGVSDNIIYFDAETNTQAVWTYPYGYSYAKTAIYSTTAKLDPRIWVDNTFSQDTLTPLTSKASANAEVGDIIYHGSTMAQIISKNGKTITAHTIDNSAKPVNSYDKFNRDFYQNFPAILTGDPLTAMFNLGGVNYFLTRRNKYQMYSQTADQWSQSQSTAQNGTFSQESVVCDLNYAYFANDTGIYRFDGSAEESLTQGSIQNVYDSITDKENIVLDLFNNRLYVFYSGKTNGDNDHCLVFNINLNKWESFDSGTFVSATSARQNSSNRFLCGHSRIGMIMQNETGDYVDLSTPISFNLETGYNHYGSTAQLKRVSKWRPEFATTKEPYSVQCGYALDYTDNVKYAFSVDLKNSQIINENYIWNNPSDYGAKVQPTKLSTIPQINGEFYRCQIRYQHIAAFEPVIFRSHTVEIQTQRIR